MRPGLNKYLIIANWKMHKTATEAAEIAKGINDKLGKHTTNIVAICPPFTALQSVAHVIDRKYICMGAQNMHFESVGAFTGEISARMLRDHFVTYVLIGHSERRSLFHEDNVCINRKLQAALEFNLKPVLCIGETLSQYTDQKTLEVIQQQLLEGLNGITKAQMSNVTIAYEPVWAIGTGHTAQPSIVQTVHAFIRNTLAELFTADTAARTRIIYGGSVTTDTIDSLLSQMDIDGALVGGASLEINSFVKIIELAALQIQTSQFELDPL